MQLTRLGPYEIGKPLGKGGMGSVYAATDTQTGQRVAIKALTPHLAAAEGFRERFEAEIESLKTLKHDGIVRLYGYGEEDGVLFYSMELVEGISLEDELKAGRRFTWREVSNIAIQLSLALKHAHDHGIVHRDIKPANILLHGDERVKLADFGIARLFGTTSLTTAGGVLGTADYMSPEQAEGRPVTARCDQYSLGGVMYALLAGRPPFRAKNLPQMLQLQRFANPEPVRRYAPDTPEQLEQVIMQLLAKDPINRFPNTQVLSRHLQAMVMALSRPAADDFALANEQPPTGRGAEIHESLAIEVTQAEAPPAKPSEVRPATAGGDRTVNSQGSQNAATLAADESLSKLSVRSAAASQALGTNTATPPPLVSPARFTTIEEEEALRSAQQKRSWLLVAAQLASFAAILATMVGVAMYLSRPPSAEKLYSSIAARVNSDDDSSLGKVEDEVNKFLQHFSDDPRADVLRGYKERIELDKLERKLQRQTRSSGSTEVSLLPVEQLYLQAIGLVDTAPDQASTRLESLIDLYGTEAPVDLKGGGPSASNKRRHNRDAAGRAADVVQLAKRRLKTLRVDTTRLRTEQLAALEERLAAADRLSETNPKQAATMYRAMLNLYDGDAWAAPVIEKVRTQLAALEKK
jgi:eukaryotic-like serine/threonine-protein kinase